MPHDERADIMSELTPGHVVVAPGEQLAPIVFCSPHSGRAYTSRFRAAARLDSLSLRKSEDCYVDELFSDAAALGAPMIAALFPRAYLDVNREPYELDPELFGARLPSYANTQSVRVAGGLGTIARIVADGEDIYRQPPTLSEALERIERLYHPFHADLAGLIDATTAQFGTAILIDCHSMPSAAMAPAPGGRPDIVIGDRFGSSCNPRLTKLVRDQLVRQGYNVQLNRPYAGGYITEHYGRPAKAVHALQVEINRSLYLDEQTLQPTSGFDYVKTSMTELARVLFAHFDQSGRRREAAE